MLQDRVTFCTQFFRTDRYSHFDVFNFPFGPCATIHPDTAVFQPFGSFFLFKVYGSKYGICTYTVCSVRVGKVTGYKDLMRLHFTEQVADNFYVGFTDRILLDFTGFVEGEVQEVTTFQRNVVVSTSCARFATAE